MSERKVYRKEDINWSSKLTNADKVRLAAEMPDIWVGNDDGSKVEWRCRDGVWRWRAIDPSGLVTAEGEGPP